jgi:hypothetical protein
LQFSVHLSVSATSPTIVQGGQLQKERCCKHLGRPGPAKKKADTKPLSAACLYCPVDNLFSTKSIC